MRAFVKHLIKWEYGWGDQIRHLDVMKIGTITYKKRLFKLTQPRLPYTLTIEYKEPYDILSITPVIGGNGVAISNTTESTQTITFRLPTEKDCKEEINKICQKQDAVDKMMKNIMADYYKDYLTEEFK